jgi:parallel beta-helix repeat protein
MKPNGWYVLLIAAFLGLAVLAPTVAPAVEIEIVVPTEFATIQEAITQAVALVSADTTTTNTYAVRVEPGTYTENNIGLATNVPVRGRETARTIINGGGDAVFTGADVTNVELKRLTLVNATTAITLTGSSSVKITNCVFRPGATGTGIAVTSPAAATVINNTFLQNAIAVTSSSDITITNNIFSGNGTALLPVSITGFTTVTNNLFHDNTIDGYTVVTGDTNLSNANLTSPDPLFVDGVSDAPDMDLHLMQNSPAIDAGSNVDGTDAVDGTQSDIGAYGGPSSDTIPFPVSGLVNTDITPDAGSDPPTSSVSWGWDQNEAYHVTHTSNPGGYNLYYRESDTTTYTKANVGNALSFSISLLSSAMTPSAPVLDEIAEYASGTLKLAWSAVDGATGYRIYYLDLGSVDGSEPALVTEEQSVDVGNVTEYDLTGLANKHLYFVEVSAIAQSTYYFAVTAYTSAVALAEGGTPGESQESALSEEVQVSIGDAVLGPRSNSVIEYPEELQSYPNLPNSNQQCFVATAAYGHYAEPHVQALRDFRDQFLATNEAGRAFVTWYYSHGPAAAAWLNEHPAYKPLVRAALLPAVGAAIFMTRTSPALKLGLMIFVISIAVFLITRKRKTGLGGVR